MTQHTDGTPPSRNSSDLFNQDFPQSPIGNDHSEAELYAFLEMRYGAGYAQNIIDNLRRYKRVANDADPIDAVKPAKNGK
ncbi:MAG: hypothetical protein EYC62_05170 [Alphaproteobacteria bacterium]|nr:MAG: hypothetical protein EYC62_05170 [Alphaproteobacteria bacterium]